MNSNAEEKLRNAEVLFSIRTKQNTSTTSENYSTTTNRDIEEETDNPQNEIAADAIMCVLFKTNRIGAAFYKKSDRQVSCLEFYQNVYMFSIWQNCQ